MNDKINLGELTVAEYNLLMKQLAMGQLNECIDLFMRLRQIGMEHQQKASGQPVAVPPPKGE
jgi:hypothetical protein